MCDLLIYFALPVATIILSVVLQKILKSPILVAATAFAIYLIVTFAAFDEGFLIYAIIYTIISYLTALLTRFICCLIRNNTNSCLNPCRNNCIIDQPEENENDVENEVICGRNNNRFINSNQIKNCRYNKNN